MEKIVQQGYLYDFYGELLTEHQKQIYEGLVYENLSLGEIADDQGISRQAVHDLVKRTDKILQGYENKLGLMTRFEKIRGYIEQVDEKLDSTEKIFPDTVEGLEEIRVLIGQIKDLI